ncbi:MAG: C1 family peptidase [Bacteroidales bacterium]
MKTCHYLVIGSMMCLTLTLRAQTPADKLIYQGKKPGFYQQIRADAGRTSEVQPVSPMVQVAISPQTFPTDPARYQKMWHQPPISQGETGTCWCFAAVSYLESECKRLTGIEVKLSEMYFVYYEYLERAAEFVKTRGQISFEEGSESSSVPLLLKRYGAVPAQAYAGKPGYLKFHYHTQMVEEMKAYLEYVKSSGAWDEETTLKVIRSILNHYMGTPPDTFDWKGARYTPLQFSREVLKLIPDDYYNFMSNIRQTQNQKGVLEEEDNWRRLDEYYNISLEDFTALVRNALAQKQTVCICGDISEPGYGSQTGAAFIPDFDIPSAYINAYARELRLNNGSTTDDHCMHLIGAFNDKGRWWYLLKDSGSGAFDCPTPGYRVMSEDYVRLKMMNIMIHKDAARPVLDKFIK